MSKNTSFNYLLAVVAASAILLSQGCEYSNLDDVADTPVGAQTVDQQPPSSSPPPNQNPVPPSAPSEGGDQRFLWKPQGESTGKLVVLLPARFTGKVSGVTVNGESGNYGGVHNGGREHYRYSKPGSAYDAPATIRASLKDGGSETWSVPSPGTRTTY
jgi:hypothetical protein